MIEAGKAKIIGRSLKEYAMRHGSLRKASCIRGLQTSTQQDSSDHCSLLLRELKENEFLRNKMANSLSFASDEDAFRSYFIRKPTDLMEEQLKVSKNQLRLNYDIKALPHNMTTAMEDKDRAIVVTASTPPFQILYVNNVWEGLCGYTLEECRGKTLSLLQGLETDKSAVTSLTDSMLNGKQGDVVLTNYTKEGRRFRNSVRVGPMDEGHFIGVLKEINDGQ